MSIFQRWSYGEKYIPTNAIFFSTKDYYIKFT